ncbi:P-loop containing nucleoside triphosphate hydrolase protein [Dunaliella salina]|uniref:Translation factor GUF1 homolog, chloroplastic n=1 Tax=Dunaliella salina TaxID=3046 RepID=A0ABQ7G3E2_DUNSA|nr:P-loop containing nucleoside triphosphate hydrolase protein [Dunaliella salina]|eukprot:KAF5829123.1 P-loop containing nucleoside triphosphate hydrolase protein [Dunaliella salina]
MALLGAHCGANSSSLRNLATKRSAPQLCRAAPAPTVPNETALPAGGPGAKYAAGQCTKVPVKNIRNFSIIAHIDHGKSTLADQLLLKTNTVAERDMVEQFMDSNDIERERGITIKLNSARMRYTDSQGELYALNLIDTPGHVDFAYEVSRSLAACEGALLVVDASQGVEAQTLANVWLALENDLEVIPVLNKIDLPGADPDRVISEIEDIIGLDCTDILKVSAKVGLGIDDVLEAIVKRVPPPKNTVDKPLRALIYDSYYDAYRGVICQFRVVDGSVSRGDRILMMNTGKEHIVDEIGVLAPNKVTVDTLYCGEVGYMAAQIKSVKDARVGDTITLSKNQAQEPLPGYVEVQPMVYCGLFPTDSNQYQDLRVALDKLQLNDAALRFEPEISTAMGFGFRCGFLGLLHMEIVQERLEREYNLQLITTAPTVIYKCVTADGQELMINSPADLPEPQKRRSMAEPYVRLEMVTPTDYVGNLIELATSRRGEYQEMRYLTENRTTLVFDIPLAEVVTDYFDVLKSRSKGYASMEYQMIGFRENDLVKLEIKINGEPADALSVITHRDNSYKLGKQLVSKLKELIPRQMFKVPIQACIGVKVIASEQIAPYRKDVTAKCYGGDISRKKKLLSKQAEGKKRMKALGRVEVPQEAFMAVLNLDND